MPLLILLVIAIVVAVFIVRRRRTRKLSIDIPMSESGKIRPFSKGYTAVILVSIGEKGSLAENNTSAETSAPSKSKKDAEGDEEVLKEIATIDDIEVQERLGGGNFGEVFKGIFPLPILTCPIFS